MMEELVEIINSDGKTLYYVPRSQMRMYNLPHRSSHIIIRNSRNQFLVTRRSFSKDIYPGLWELGQGGVVTKGESYERCAVRELKEEVGVSPPLRPLFDMYISNPSNNVLTRVFTCTLGKTARLRLQKEEIADYAWVPSDSLPSVIARMPFTPDSHAIYTQLRVTVQNSGVLSLVKSVAVKAPKRKSLKRYPTQKKSKKHPRMHRKIRTAKKTKKHKNENRSHKKTYRKSRTSTKKASKKTRKRLR